MPVLARCPLCRAVLPAGSADAPGEVRCPRCAEMVLPATRKLCARCSRDVTRAKRKRDATGEYYCPGCWATVAAESAGKGAFLCAICGGSFASHEVSQDRNQFVCRTCRTARNLNPQGHLVAASDPGAQHTTSEPRAERFSRHQARQRRRQQMRIAVWIGGALVLTVVIAVALVYLRR